MLVAVSGILVGTGRKRATIIKTCAQKRTRNRQPQATRSTAPVPEFLGSIKSWMEKEKRTCEAKTLAGQLCKAAEVANVDIVRKHKNLTRYTINQPNFYQ
jgi:hypothetical protein